MHSDATITALTVVNKGEASEHIHVSLHSTPEAAAEALRALAHECGIFMHAADLMDEMPYVPVYELAQWLNDRQPIAFFRLIECTVDAPVG